MNLPETRCLLLRFDAGVLHLTLNRPEARNAMSLAMVAELDATFDAVAASSEVRAVVVRGAGGHFCAGGDLKDMAASGLRPPAPGEADPIATMSRRFGSLLRKAAALPAVMIVICEGSVLAGGLGLVCVSDIALAHTAAKFGVPETSRGLPPAQIAPFLVERIGLTQARRLCLTGAPFDGVQALALGLVHEVFADDDGLLRKLDRCLGQVLNCAPQANRMTKEILLSRAGPEAILDDAATTFAACVRGAEAPEGIAAFMQKRKPGWAP